MGLTTRQILKILQLKGLGRKTAFKICEKAGDEVIDTDHDLAEFVKGCIANNWIRQLPEVSKYDFETAFSKAEEIIEKSEYGNIKILSYYDEHFPKSLKTINDPPILLNFKGDYKSINDLVGVAIIGTREPTNEGIKSGEFFGNMFGKSGFNIVSGLALGCDAAAHRGCLKSNGFTTAIVAHGLHTVYPKDNKQLAEDIVATGGVLLSEYSVGTGALANYFVERDRLQAGLAMATIVIQTGIKGGTMHAVNATIDSNKILAAVKYKSDLYSEKISGNTMLINQKGAFALTSESYEELIGRLKKEPMEVKKQEFTVTPESSTGKRSKKKKSKTDNTDQLKIGFGND